jgi:hypothetical protein
MASDNLNWLAHLPEGWHPLYRDLVVGLADLDPDIVVVQAKQKFGELRVYLGKYHADAAALIRTAESQSQAMCELCGDVGELRISRTGWVRTLCDAHGHGFRPTRIGPEP